VAPNGIPAHTLLSGAYLGTEERELKPGSEVVTQPTQVLGMTARGSIAAGARVLVSRLRAAYDVPRGSTVTMVIRAGAVELRAQAVALNDAYLGQTLVVKRVDDDVKFKGRVEEGPVVVVE
jgi:flagella basal body P-ring formation protein FlgA